MYIFRVFCVKKTGFYIFRIFKMIARFYKYDFWIPDKILSWNRKNLEKKIFFSNRKKISKKKIWKFFEILLFQLEIGNFGNFRIKLKKWNFENFENLFEDFQEKISKNPKNVNIFLGKVFFKNFEKHFSQKYVDIFWIFWYFFLKIFK